MRGRKLREQIPYIYRFVSVLLDSRSAVLLHLFVFQSESHCCVLFTYIIKVVPCSRPHGLICTQVRERWGL